METTKIKYCETCFAPAKYCNKCLLPMCYKEKIRVCKVCLSTYEKGHYKICSINHHRYTEKTGKYWGFNICLDLY